MAYGLAVMISQKERYLPSQERIEEMTAEFREKKLKRKKGQNPERRRRLHNTRVYRFTVTGSGPMAEVIE